MADPGLTRARQVAVAPRPERNWALFLDLDGTLLDIAARPDAVVVPHDLAADLEAASRILGGALAIVSGRQLGDLDRLLAPLRLPSAGEHGAIIRLPDGLHDQTAVRVPLAWVEALKELETLCPGVLVEVKSHNVVAHYRNAPAYEARVRRLVCELASHNLGFEVLEAKMAFEIRPRSVSKGRAVDCLMSVDPFCGRVPVFVGDDVTDRDGFAAALARGGLALDVAEVFAGRPKEVRAWLKRFAEI